MVSIFAVCSILRHKQNVLVTSVTKILLQGFELHGAHPVVLHVRLETKAGAATLPPQSSVVFREVGVGLVAAGGRQDHEILVLAGLLQDLAIPVEVEEVPTRLLDPEAQGLLEGVRARAGSRPVGLHALEPILSPLAGTLAQGRQGPVGGLQTRCRNVAVLESLRESLSKSRQLQCQSLLDLLPALVSAVHLTLHHRQRRGDGHHRCCHARLRVQVREVRRAGRAEGLL
mmetsp:Transcript_11612/g.22070  ORF Transcript_11612/g.22070 Transcript_11612/m.22070 type:complete len:229 (-) Transcript_11612:1277-1963(-)